MRERERERESESEKIKDSPYTRRRRKLEPHFFGGGGGGGLRTRFSQKKIIRLVVFFVFDPFKKNAEWFCFFSIVFRIKIFFICIFIFCCCLQVASFLIGKKLKKRTLFFSKGVFVVALVQMNVCKKKERGRFIVWFKFSRKRTQRFYWSSLRAHSHNTIPLGTKVIAVSSSCNRNFVLVVENISKSVYFIFNK